MSDCRFGVSPVNYPDPDCIHSATGPSGGGKNKLRRIVCLKQHLKPDRIVNYDTVQTLLNFAVESHHSELRLGDTIISLWSNRKCPFCVEVESETYVFCQL